jgi:hypothetical protein
MTSILRRTFVLTAVLAVSGCSLPPLLPRSPTDPPAGSGSRAQRPAPARKEVVEKRDMSLLVARDGSSCTVPDHVFRSTEIGDRIACLWRA